MSPLIYVLKRLGFRIMLFIEHYWIDGFRFFFGKLIDCLEGMDRSLAIRISFKNLFKPLYGRRDIFGYSFGFIFRSLRIGLAGLIYALISVLFMLGYLIWAMIPFWLIYKMFKTGI